MSWITVLIRCFFANIYSQSVTYLLILLMLPFTEKKILVLMKFILPVISFMDGAFGVTSKKLTPWPEVS